jgi:hypothetical protein
MTLDAAADLEMNEAIMASEHSSSEDEEHVRSVPGRHATIIHRRARVKSTEGLLSFYTNEKPSADEHQKAQDAEPHTPESPSSEPEPIMVQRAKSVDLGKHHVRHLSAGSARLLDISKQKRSSSNSNSYSKKSELEQ